MLKSHTALGIDVSDGWITLALLARKKDGVKLMKAACAPVPDGAVKDGNITNATALAKAIKKLKSKNRIRSHRTVFSLIANPTLMQILDLPREARGNARQFVNNEVKHYAVLPIKKAAVDFCGIKTSSKSRQQQVLVVATDSQKITNAARALRREGLNIEAIEPSWIAYTRACYAKKIAGIFDTNRIFATVYDRMLTLSLFRNQRLDFVRTKRIEPFILQSEDYHKWLAEEINAVIKFYELKDPNKHNQWRVTLVTDIGAESVPATTESLSTGLGPVELEVRTLEHTRLTIAVGLAMKLLKVPGCGLNIDLLPADLIEAKVAEKQTLAMANVAAAIIFLVILSVGFLSAKVNNVNAQIMHNRQTQVNRKTPALLDEQTSLQRQTTNLSEMLDFANNILSTGTNLKWGRILEDIRQATPKSVRITALSSNDNSSMVLEGQALSYAAIYLFVDELGTCRNIESASLIGTEKYRGSDSLVKYSVRCSLTQERNIR
jgi:hypothetical protein